MTKGTSDPLLYVEVLIIADVTDVGRDMRVFMDMPLVVRVRVDVVRVRVDVGTYDCGVAGVPTGVRNMAAFTRFANHAQAISKFQRDFSSFILCKQSDQCRTEKETKSITLRWTRKRGQGRRAQPRDK